jgi:hypothetical protein
VRNDKAGPGRTLIPLELKLTRRKEKGVVRQESQTSKQGEKKAKDERESSTDMWNELTAF